MLISNGIGGGCVTRMGKCCDCGQLQMQVYLVSIGYCALACWVRVGRCSDMVIVSGIDGFKLGA